MSETSFMWKIDEKKSHGLNIDLVKQEVSWYDDASACTCGDKVACCCDGATSVQSFEQFEQDGPALVSLPEGVLAKIQKVRDS